MKIIAEHSKFLVYKFLRSNAVYPFCAREPKRSVNVNHRSIERVQLQIATAAFEGAMKKEVCHLVPSNGYQQEDVQGGFLRKEQQETLSYVNLRIRAGECTFKALLD